MDYVQNKTISMIKDHKRAIFEGVAESSNALKFDRARRPVNRAV